MTGEGRGWGLTLALCGFAALSLGDAVIKSIAGEWPATAVAALRFTIGAAGLGAILAWREGRAGFAFPRPGWQLLRGTAIAISSLAFFASLFLMPLAEATATTFTGPIWTALLAAAILGERVRKATLAATVLAFAGTLVVLRPNLAELGVAALLPLVAAVTFALLHIGNRVTAGAGSALAMQFYLQAIAAPLLVAFAWGGNLSGWPPLAFGWPDWTVVARCALVALTASAAHTLIFTATARTSPARVAPMTYVQLLVAGALGWAAFGEAPDAVAWLGAGVIVAAGLILWWSGRTAAPG